MDKEIIQILVDLAKSGGTSACWVIMGLQIISVLKTVICWTGVFLVIKTISRTIFEAVKFGVESEK